MYKMKKKVRNVLSLIALVASMISCAPLQAPTPVLSLSVTAISIEKASTTTVVASSDGLVIDPSLVQWEVIDTSIASVDSQGIVSATKAGTTVLNAILKANGESRARADIVVLDTTQPMLSGLSSPASILDNQALTISVTGTDLGEGSLVITLENAGVTLCEFVKGPSATYSASYSGLTSATYTGLVVKAIDESGNAKTLAVPSLRVKSTDSALSQFSFASMAMSPSFSPAVFNYSGTAKAGGTYNLTATRRSSTATASTSQSGTNPKTLTVVVTAEAGAPYISTYKLVVSFK